MRTRTDHERIAAEIRPSGLAAHGAPLPAATPFKVERRRNRWGCVTFINTAVTRDETMSTRTILIVVVLLLLLGALPTWPYSSAWGYYPSGGLGLVLLILVVLLLLGRI